MDRDYYQDLGIERDADESQISKAYRKLALTWHPKISKYDISKTYQEYCKISEAYEVLSDPNKRNFFDKYGSEKLKQGFFTSKSDELKGGYTFKGNPDEIFEKFFGTTDVYAQLIDYEDKEAVKSIIGSQFDKNLVDQIRNPENLVLQIECTLVELFQGCKKDIQYQRKALTADGQSIKEVIQKKIVEIKPGYQDNQELRYKEEGNCAPGVKNSDLIIKIKQLPHNKFQRKENNLIYKVKISLVDALCSKPINITTIDNRVLYIPIDEVINPNTQKIVPEEGMPIYNPNEFTVENFQKKPEKGDLIILFDIVCPEFIEEEKKEAIKNILQECFDIEQK